MGGGGAVLDGSGQVRVHVNVPLRTCFCVEAMAKARQGDEGSDVGDPRVHAPPRCSCHLRASLWYTHGHKEAK